MTAAGRDNDGRSRCRTRSWKIGQQGGFLNIRKDVLSIWIQPHNFWRGFSFRPRCALRPKLYRGLLRERERRTKQQYRNQVSHRFSGGQTILLIYSRTLRAVLLKSVSRASPGIYASLPFTERAIHVLSSHAP